MFWQVHATVSDRYGNSLSVRATIVRTLQYDGDCENISLIVNVSATREHQRSRARTFHLAAHLQLALVLYLQTALPSRWRSPVPLLA